MSRTCVVIAAMGLIVGCGRSAPTANEKPADHVVASWGAVQVRASDVRHAQAARPSPPAEAAVEILIDEVLAQRARMQVPGAAARATAAGRRVAVDQLLDAELNLPPADIDRYYRDHTSELTRPAQVKLAHIVLPDCAAALRLRARLDAGELDFAAAAAQQSTDRASGLAGGDLGWRSLDQLADAELAALDELDRPGAISAPFPDGGRCRLLRLVERRAEATPDLKQARSWARMRLLTERRGEVRRALLARLGETGKVRIDEAVLAAVVEGAPTRPEAPVVSLGDDSIPAAELRASLPPGGVVPGGAAAWRRVLAEDFAMWREARRRGLDQAPAVRSAERALLVAELRDALTSAITPETIPAAEVRKVYDLDRGDYTTPRRVRLAGLVTRDAGKAARWVKALRASPAPADEHKRLLSESEDAAARDRGGDLGWVDGRSTHYPDSFKAAALALPRPGAVSGVIVAAGVHHVLLCVDFVAERVNPLAEVEPMIRTKLAERQRREAWQEARRAARELAEPGLDESSLARLAQDAG